MSFTDYEPTTWIHPEKVTLRNLQFAKFISRRTGVSATAISNALIIIGEGITDALAAGFDVQWRNIGTFETREMKSRVRYHRAKGERYVSKPSTIVHFKKSELLTNTVRQKSKKMLQEAVEAEHIKSGGN